MHNSSGDAPPTVPDAAAHEVTLLLKAWASGDDHAPERLAPLVYGELRRRAHYYVRRAGSAQTLQTTAVANEVWLRLAEAHSLNFNDRVHFFAVCAQLMRRILVDAARARGAQKRGGGALRITLDEVAIVSAQKGEDLIAMDDALTRLAAIDPRRARMIELRFFGGLSVEETAQALKISVQSVHRDWQLARAWLLQDLRRGVEKASSGLTESA
ncbi:MAG TPA: sigma-70 family RNA polymerase sigma factor [Bryobacteraceae bacterium]|nr:sigma-70 family RNA polymerase sigma factor [Bryobacteraceae bacterium]